MNYYMHTILYQLSKKMQDLGALRLTNMRKYCILKLNKMQWRAEYAGKDKLSF